jgi:hypothetical protein
MSGGATRNPPTSSWWALETPVTLARCGSDKRSRGGSVAAEARSEWRSRRRHTAGIYGHHPVGRVTETQTGWKEEEEEEKTAVTSARRRCQIDRG